MAGGLLRPKHKILGCDIAERVEALRKNLTQALLEDLLQAGKVVSVVDRRYAFSDVAIALVCSEEKHTRGKAISV